MTVAKWIRAVLPVVALVAGAGCEQPNEFVAPPPPEVAYVQPVQRDVEIWQEFIGHTDAVDSVEVRSRVPGFLEEVGFVDGQPVTKGQLLFRIEPAPYQAALNAAEAALASARAAAELQRVYLERVSRAAEQEAASELEVLEAKAKLDVATADVDAAEAALEKAQLDLSYTEIRSPIDGIASRTLLSIGDLVESSSQLLTTLVSIEPMHAYFTIAERDVLPYLRTRAERAAEGQAPPLVACRLRFADGEIYDTMGTIDFADNVADRQTGTVTVRGVFANPSGVLRPGLFVRIGLVMRSGPAVLLPGRAIQRDTSGSFVLALGTGDKVERKDVVTGSELEDGMRVVESGLGLEDRVIVDGLLRIRPGVEAKGVAVVPPAKPAGAAGGMKDGPFTGGS